MKNKKYYGKTEQYRFDNACERVYEYDREANAYLNLGSYYAFGIKAKDSEQIKTSKVENWKNEVELYV
jgi:hypothetical protein